jgi:hypothetical protein
VVSIDVAAIGAACNFDPTSSADSVNIPNPDANPVHSCSAWRNTTTLAAIVGHPWHLELGLGHLPEEYAGLPIGIQFQAQHVAADYAQNDRIVELVKAHKGIYRNTPPYLIPALRKKTCPRPTSSPLLPLFQRVSSLNKVVAMGIC